MKTAVVNRIINEKGECLFLLRATKPFGWCLAGGKVDAGEVPAESCIRETLEETGVNLIGDAFEMKYVGESVSFNGTPVTVFETVLDHTPEITISKREHLSYRWIKTHKFEYAHNFTSEMYKLSIAGNTLDFLDLGRPYFVPDFL
jgi:ADP-ribose pyrophosphatase YjhB (NUDIX family)